MIVHELHQTKIKWYQVLVWDFVVPLALVFFAAWYLDQKLAKPLLQYLVDLPYVGIRLYRSPFFPWYVKWHYWIFVFPPLLFSISVSFRTARIPGPGRAFMRWWQGLLHMRVNKEVFIDPFPPPFDEKAHPAAPLVHSEEARNPECRVFGFGKRFGSDLEQDKREGKEPEAPSDYFPLILTVETRFRHMQVIGGSGSGKSAAVIAPLLRKDSATSRIATLTINPKADLYLLKVMADGGLKRRRVNPADKLPTALISFSRKESLAYDPLLYGDADTLTKKIMGSSEITHSYYRSIQETWLMTFFRVMKTEPRLVDRIMLRHLFQFLIRPSSVEKTLREFCVNENNLIRLQNLSLVKAESLSGLASHISQLVEDESLTHVFDNPKGRLLNVREVVRRGGNIFIEVDTSSKGPQGRALGRMIMMEMQLLAGARQTGHEPKDKAVQILLDEFASFAYSGFIDLLDKCRSARMGLLLSHQSIGNLQRDNLSRSFKDEVVDNTHTKIFLSIKGETAEWASKEMGTRLVVKKSMSVGHATEKTVTRGRESQSVSYREEFEPYVQPSAFNLGLGHGYGMIEDKEGRLVKGPIRLGYVDERDLCSDKELFAFLQSAMLGHPFRPRGGSLIDNSLPEGEPEDPLSPVPPLSANDFDPNTGNPERDKEKPPTKPNRNPPDDPEDWHGAFDKDEPLSGGPNDEGN